MKSQMHDNSRNQNNGLLHPKIVETPTRRVNRIFVVEAIKTENEETLEPRKYEYYLIEPCHESCSQLLIWIIGYVFIIILLSVAWSIPISVIPMTNPIISPRYWWEVIVNGTFFMYSLSETGFTIIEIKIIFNLKLSTLLKPFAWSFALHFLSTTVCLCLCYLGWTVWLENNHPIPFVGLICYFCCNTVHYASIWFILPYKMRNNGREKRKVFAFILYRLCVFIITLQRQALIAILGKLAQSQWIMGLVFPLFREINLWFVGKIWKKWSDSDDNNDRIFDLTATVLINLQHAVSVAITISTKTSRLTTLCILTADTLLNLYETYRIIKRFRMISPENTDVENRNKWRVDALKLSGIEIVEFLTPIAYSITFAMVFYGKNAGVIGGVKYDEWQYKEVTDIISFLTETGMMFIVDFLCTVMSGVLLWKFAKVNLLEEGYKLLRFLWPLISLNLAGKIFLVIDFAN